MRFEYPWKGVRAGERERETGEGCLNDLEKLLVSFNRLSFLFIDLLCPSLTLFISFLLTAVDWSLEERRYIYFSVAFPYGNRRIIDENF